MILYAYFYFPAKEVEISGQRTETICQFWIFLFYLAVNR